MITLYESLLDDEEEVLAQADEKFGLIKFWEDISSKNENLKNHWQVKFEDNRVCLKPTTFKTNPWGQDIEELTIMDFSFKQFCEKIDVIIVPPGAKIFLRIYNDRELDFTLFPEIKVNKARMPYHHDFEFCLDCRCGTVIKNLNSDIFPKNPKVTIKGDDTEVKFDNLNWKGRLQLWSLIIKDFKNCFLDQEIDASTCEFDCKTLPDMMIRSIIRRVHLRLCAKTFTGKGGSIVANPTYENGVVIVPKLRDPEDSVNLDVLYKYRDYFKEIDCNQQSISIYDLDMLPLLKNASEYVFWDAERIDTSKYKHNPRHAIIKFVKLQKANIILDDSNDNTKGKYFQDYSSLAICTNQGLDKVTSNCRTIVFNRGTSHQIGLMDLCDSNKSLTSDEINKIISLKNFPKAKSIVISSDVGAGWWNRKMIALNKMGNKWNVINFKK